LRFLTGSARVDNTRIARYLVARYLKISF